jgi:dihydroneopterin aldolase
MIPSIDLQGERCLIISKLKLSMLIGILPEEMDNPQEVLVSVAAYVPETGPATSEDVADYVSYADIVTGIREIAAAGHTPLVENFAEAIAAMVLEDDRVSRVQVDIRKTEIIPEAEAVGVIIERSRAPV